MTRREKFFKTVKRELEGYIPFEFSLCPSLNKKFKEKTGKEDYVEYYDFPLRRVSARHVERNIDFSKYFDIKDEDVVFDHWGVGYKMGSVEHFSKMLHPMANFETIEDFEKFPYPDPVKDYDWSLLPHQIKKIKENDLISVAEMACTVFEISWYLRGMDNFMVDLLSNTEIACYHMDRIVDIRCECAKRYVEAGVDVLHLGDDVGTQRGMMISPEVWREFLKPRLKKVIDSAREVNPEIIIDYHSDGNIEDIIPELIEIGVDILNPVQPECMDPVKLKECYGHKLSFRGTIGTQTVMPFGTPEEVDKACKEMIEKVGKGGGLILAPTHLLEPEVPWENIEAMVNAVKKYSKI